MKRISVRAYILAFILGAIAPGIYAQNNNRISIQTGLFHSFFDQTPIVNTTRNLGKRYLRNLFGGTLIDSKGIQYQRLLNDRSSISAEYMFLNAGVAFSKKLTQEIDPMVMARNIKTVNITYMRKLNIANQLCFVYGGGLNYRWGHESIYLYTNFAGWGYESRITGYYRNDWGLNVRTGIEYSPLKWLTLYTNFDFLGIVYLQAKDLDGNYAYDYFKNKYGRTNIPSRYDLSWNFGIGFNFLK